MEIVDAQVHLNQLVPDWRTADPDAVIATALVTMDAVGIDTVLIAESRGVDPRTLRPALATVLPNGAVRSVYPLSERAAAAHPERFAYLMRVDHTDPELERLVAGVRNTPGALCLRVHRAQLLRRHMLHAHPRTVDGEAVPWPLALALAQQRGDLGLPRGV